MIWFDNLYNKGVYPLNRDKAREYRCAVFTTYSTIPFAIVGLCFMRTVCTVWILKPWKSLEALFLFTISSFNKIETKFYLIKMESDIFCIITFWHICDNRQNTAMCTTSLCVPYSVDITCPSVNVVCWTKLTLTLDVVYVSLKQLSYSGFLRFANALKVVNNDRV